MTGVLGASAFALAIRPHILGAASATEGATNNARTEETINSRIGELKFESGYPSQQTVTNSTTRWTSNAPLRRIFGGCQPSALSNSNMPKTKSLRRATVSG